MELVRQTGCDYTKTLGAGWADLKPRTVDCLWCWDSYIFYLLHSHHAEVHTASNAAVTHVHYSGLIRTSAPKIKAQVEIQLRWTFGWLLKTCLKVKYAKFQFQKRKTLGCVDDCPSIHTFLWKIGRRLKFHLRTKIGLIRSTSLPCRRSCLCP